MSAKIQSIRRSGQVGTLICACLLALSPVAASAQAGASSATPPGVSYEGPDLSPDGIELSGFLVGAPARVGRKLIISYSLKNTSSQRIHFSGGGPALAVRIEAGGKKEQRTLRPTVSVTELYPGAKRRILFSAVELDVAGTWRVSPVYEIDGRSGPTRWHELEFDVAPAPTKAPARPPVPERIDTLLGNCRDSGTLPHGLAAHIAVEGLQSPRVGDTLKVRFTYQNLWVDRPAVFGRKGVFVAARYSPKGGQSQQRRDFGHQLPYVVLRAYSPTRTIAVEETIFVDAAGTWLFWPSFEIDGGEAPERWCAVTVSVED